MKGINAETELLGNFDYSFFSDSPNSLYARGLLFFACG